MSKSQPVTETVILHLRPGINLQDVYAGKTGASGSLGHELTNLARTLREQNGCIRQFWGQQVENQNIFIWSIDWESFDLHATFIKSERYKDFIAGVAQVFDLEAAGPMIIHTAFTSDASAAREAPVTEVAFFMLSKEVSEETKAQLEDDFMPVLKAATSTGNCSAFAVGWIFEEQQHPQATNEQAITFNALLGWPSVEDHMNFRNAPEFLEVIGPVREAVLPPVQGKSVFHVKFQVVS